VQHERQNYDEEFMIGQSLLTVAECDWITLLTEAEYYSFTLLFCLALLNFMFCWPCTTVLSFK